MNWKIVITDTAERDMYDIYQYIADVLHEPTTAERIFMNIEEAVYRLGSMPFLHRVYEKEPWQSRGIRFMPVNKYLVFYSADELTSTVKILHIIYGARDIDKCLEDIL